MRILICTGPFNIGGGEMIINNLIKSLPECKFYVACFGKRADNWLSESVESKTIETVYIDGNHISRLMKLNTLIGKVKPDVIHSHLSGNPYAVMYSHLRGVPIISTMHTVPSMAYSTKTEKLIRILLKKNMCYCVAVSNENLFLSKKYFGNSERLIAINNGIDIKDKKRKEHNGFTLINVARQDINKNQRLIIRAFHEICKKYDDCNLILLGDGECHDDLLHQIDKYGLTDKISMPGEVSNPGDYYAISDVYIQSSHREGLPLSIIEAMAYGLPIISSNVGGIRDIVVKNGVLFNDDDLKGLVDAIDRLHRKDTVYIDMCNESLICVTKYSVDCMGQQYKDLYRRVCNKQNG